MRSFHALSGSGWQPDPGARVGRWPRRLGLAALAVALLAGPWGVEAARGAEGDTDPAAHPEPGHATEAGDTGHDAAPAGEGGAAHGESGQGAAHGGEPELGAALPLWSIIPFAGILLSIAVFPLVAPHFWHHRFPLVAAGWGLAFAVPFVAVYGHDALHAIYHIYLIDYIPFIILLWSLFTVAGGIMLRGTMVGRPAVNVLLLAIGTLIASWTGTTGAAMILIRPLLRANADRRHKVHTVVFFIFLVANVGGSLTPLGDPPLFLGFLHGVPFFWTLSLFPHMALVAILLLGVYYLLDSMYYRREMAATTPDAGDAGAAAATAAPAAGQERVPLRLEGAHNFLFLLGVLAGVIASGILRLGDVEVLGVRLGVQNILRDGWLVLMGLGSLWTTRRQTRLDNRFTWFPIQEVAYLFAGIFMTIIPALEILKAGEAGALAWLLAATETPSDYFWITGILSSFLDNAPTYLTFLSSALGKFYTGMTELEAVHALIAERVIYLKAISVGAVFMGANTYIGNAPNFMVRSIAEENGVAMPSFFGYMIKYSMPILLPLFVLVTLVFLR